MRRADRLFRIVQVLRRRRFVTATQLAEQLEVSERTIYRDVRDLIGSGVPILGEAGVGYRLERGFDLPPLAFNEDEIEALVLGARMVQHYGDEELRRAARSILDKTHAVVPERAKERLASTALFALSFGVPKAALVRLGPIRQATAARKKILLTYVDEHGSESERIVRPLGLYFWGNVWTLGAYCELRSDFRTFRLDRIGALEVRSESFELVPPCTLELYVAAVERQRRSP